MALYILIEGDADERFFKSVLNPKLTSRFHETHFWKYSQTKKENTIKLLDSIRLSHTFVFVGDLDELPCVSEKKRRVVQEYGSRIGNSSIAVVEREIEAWYMAGLRPRKLRWMGFSSPNTDEVRKEDFDRHRPHAVGRTEFMLDLLAEYNLRRGTRRNRSLAHFVDNWA